ncbi:MAG: 3-dehydroquinate synthase [Limisphaerales bacterium]
MPIIERTLHLAYRHRVLFTDGVFSPENPLLAGILLENASRKPVRALVTVDAQLAASASTLQADIERYFTHRAGLIELAGTPWLIPGGEEAKNSPTQVAEIHAAIERHALCRHSYVVAIGGGAHLDVVGLAAATAHRGVRHVRIPSTTLAQADSGVGVKNGINAFGKKNFIGTFAPPFAVINDFSLLASLSPRDRRAGFVEAVKVALIRDREFFEWIEANADSLAAFAPEPMRHLIHRCAELHVEHIATGGDPFELGPARPLDFGHWSAHKLEALSRFQLRHGEAVAIGIALDTIYARRTGLLEADSAGRILALLERLGFQLFAAELIQRDHRGRLEVLGGLDEFREHLGGNLTVTLLAAIGRGIEVNDLKPDVLAQAVAELEWRARPRCGVPD